MDLQASILTQLGVEEPEGDCYKAQEMSYKNISDKMFSDILTVVCFPRCQESSRPLEVIPTLLCLRVTIHFVSLN